MTTTIPDIVVIVIFCAWFILSILGQIRIDQVQKIRKKDLFSIIPQYNFFAPTPGTKDFHVLTRNKFPDGELTGWKEVMIPKKRSWWNIVWNPYRREKKAIFDLATTLAKELKAYKAESVQISMSYLALLNYASNMERFPGTTHCQFMIMMTHGFFSGEQPIILFTSNMHRI